eukprot:351955-Chlamydomonas_euryale.AAC.3
MRDPVARTHHTCAAGEGVLRDTADALRRLVAGMADAEHEPPPAPAAAPARHALLQLRFFDAVMLLLERERAPDGATLFARAALQQLDAAYPAPGDAAQRASLRGRLWANVFSYSVDTEEWGAAYAAVLANPLPNTALDSLRRLVHELCARGQVCCVGTPQPATFLSHRVPAAAPQQLRPDCRAYQLPRLNSGVQTAALPSRRAPTGALKPPRVQAAAPRPPRPDRPRACPRPRRHAGPHSVWTPAGRHPHAAVARAPVRPARGDAAGGGVRRAAAACTQQRPDGGAAAVPRAARLHGCEVELQGATRSRARCPPHHCAALHAPTRSSIHTYLHANSQERAISQGTPTTAC